MSSIVWKNLKSLGIASIGAGAAYLLAGVTQIDFGAYTPVIVAGASVLANVVKTSVEAWIAANK